MGWNFGYRGIAVGKDYHAVIFLMLGEEVDRCLKIGSSSTSQLNLGGDFLKRQQGHVDRCVKLDYIYKRYAVGKETIDYPEEPHEILLIDRSAGIDSYQQTGDVGVEYTHLSPSIAAAGAHTRQSPRSGDDGRAEHIQPPPDIVSLYGRGLDQPLNIAGERTPLTAEHGVFDATVDIIHLYGILFPQCCGVVALIIYLVE